MRITQVNIEGAEGRFAELLRKRGSPSIKVSVILPEGISTEFCPAGEAGQITAVATRLHLALEVHAGTPQEVAAYMRAIQSLA